MNNIISGGKGCFRAGTLIQQQNGKTTPIELIKVGDEVLAFDELGEIRLAKVTEVHYHEEPEPLMKVKFWNGEICITPNHWVLNQYEAFAEIGRMTIHDALVDGMGHLRPIIDSEYIGKEPVWNLTVEPHHTFIANNIRVHNGGFRERFPVIEGSKGSSKGGGSTRVPVEAPDSLRSRQYAKVIDLISEGEIVGLVNGMKSIYLDDTPLQSENGSMNFSGVSYDVRTGTQWQSHFDGFSAVESENVVGTEVTYGNPIVRTLSNPNANAVRITVSVPGLTSTDTSTGDISGTSVTIGVEVSENGGGFVSARLSTAYVDFAVSSPYANSGSNYINYAELGIKWTGATPIVYGTGDYWYWGGIYIQNESQSCSFLAEYRQTPGGSWTSFWSETLTGSVTSYTPIYYWNETSPTEYLAPNVDKTIAVNLAEAPYEFRVTKTGGDGTVSITSGRGVSWVSTDVISGKTTSTYQKSYRVPLSGTGPWDIKVTRHTADSTSSALHNKTWWDSYTEIIDNKLRYPNSAMVALCVDSEQFNAIPTRGYEIYGIKVKVPTNYTPSSRTYSGVWDGTFKVEWTDNPAWCFYDLVTNDRYGLGNFIQPDQIDKWSLYTIAQYCDELVPNGFGGYEPRFTCNLYLQTREEAYKVVNYVASIFRGMVYWAGGTLIPTCDSPMEPVALFNASNVIDGSFSYEGTSARARHTVALVSWNDPKDRYKQKVEYVEDEEGIARFGIIQSEILAVGCTSRGQAHRIGKWLIYSERNESEVVKFKTGLDGLIINPGDVIKTTDPTRSGERMGGRVVVATTTQVTVDSDIVIESGKSYSIWLILPDGTVVNRAVTTSPSTTKVLDFSPAVAERPQSQSIWVLSANDLVPETWRVIGISEADQGTAEITALSHRNDKYSHVENNTYLIDLPTLGVALIPDPPESGQLSDTIYFNGPNIQSKLLVSWKTNKTAYKYNVHYKKNGENWIDLQNTLSSSIEIANVVDGAAYTVRVYSTNALGARSSTYLEMTHTVLGKLAPPSNVASISNTVNLTSVFLSWDDILDIDRYDFGLCEGSSWALPITWISGTSYTLPPMTAGNHTIRIKARDTTGNVSVSDASTVVSIIPPALPDVTTEFVDSMLVASWPDCTRSHQLVSYEIRIGGTTWDNATYHSTTTARTVSITPNWSGNNTIRVKATDIAGNISAEGGGIANVVLPSAPSLSASILGPDVELKWSATKGSLPIITYEVRWGASWNASTFVTRISATSFKYRVDWSGGRTWWVAAVDSAGNVGPAGSVLSTVQLPGMPTVTYTFEATATRLKWNSVKTTLDIVSYEVVRGAEPQTGVFIGSTDTTTIGIPVDWKESATFWVRAKDTAGNYGPYGSSIVGIVAPTTPLLGYYFSGEFCVLSWDVTTTVSNSLPAAGYEVRYGDTWETGVVAGITTDSIIRIPADWQGTRIFFLKSFNSAGTYGSESITYVTVGTYDSPTGLSLVQSLTDLVLTWNPAIGGQTPISYYEVRHGDIWDLGVTVGKTSANTLTIPINWNVPPLANSITRTFWVNAIDVFDGVGAAQSISFTINKPSAVNVSHTIVAVKAQLSWLAPVATLPIDYYEIRYTTPSTPAPSWDTALPITKQYGTDYRVSVDWTGTRTFWVAAVDVNGNRGTAGTTVVSIGAPNAPVVSSHVTLDTFVVTWNTPTSTLPVTDYEIRYNDDGSSNYGTSILYGRSNTNTIAVKGEWLGNRTFWVTAIDVNGTAGTPGSTTLTINAPAAPTGYRQEVVDNNVLLYWNQVQGTMPTVTYELRKGDTWATAGGLGQKAGGFTTIFETSAGTFTYWIAAVDSAGNVGTPTSLVCVVNTPPDYVLKLNYESTFTGTKTNAISDNGTLLLPVITTESYQQHFNNNSWATPQAQVTAGFPIYIQPTTITGTYTETYDYGTILSANKITLTVNSTLIAGSVTLSATISASVDGSTWTDYVGVFQTYATNFRYIKFTLTATASNTTGLMRINGINLRLDSKLKTITSVVNCLASITGATYSQTGTTTLTVSATGTWTAGRYVDLAFTSGTAASGIYRIVTGGTNTFTVTASVATNTSGNVNIDPEGTVMYLTETGLHTGQKVFVDVDAIQVSAAGTTPLTAIYNFTDVANPLYLKALLFNQAGARQSGTASVTVRGF